MGRQADGCCGARTAPGQLWVWDGSTDLGPWGIFLSSQIISQIWPYLSMIMENKFREKLEPKIREKSVHLRTFAFTKLYFGQKVGAVSGGAAGSPPPPGGSHLTHRVPSPHLHFPVSRPEDKPLSLWSPPHCLWGF